MNENAINDNQDLNNAPVKSEISENNTDSGATSEDELQRNRFQTYFSEAVESEGPKLTAILNTFLELKNIDGELAEIDEEKGDLPENINIIKSKLESIESKLSTRKTDLSSLEKEKSELLETDKSYEDKINKYDEQKYDVRNNKEYDEIVKTIESLFEEVQKNENRIKIITTESEKISAEVTEFESKFNELNSELQEKQALLDELNEEFKQEETVLISKRNELSSKLDDESKSLYERINKMHKGEATAIVRKGNCSGCYNSIPPQRVIEIKSAEKIYTCQSCGRILVSEDFSVS